MYREMAKEIVEWHIAVMCVYKLTANCHSPVFAKAKSNE